MRPPRPLPTHPVKLIPRLDGFGDALVPPSPFLRMTPFRPIPAPDLWMTQGGGGGWPDAPWPERISSWFYPEALY